MSDQSTSKDRINILKKRARKLSKNLSILQSDALTKIAKDEGYQSWFLCSNAIKNGAPITDEPSTLSKNTAPKHSHRMTLLDYSGEFFDSLNSFRNRLENEIKDSLKRGKGAKLIVQLYLSPDQIQELKAPDSIFSAILDRFDNLQRIELHETEPSESPLMETMINPEPFFTGE